MQEFPIISTEDWVLREFEIKDTSLVEKASSDPLIPLITSIPAQYTRQAALEYIERQNQRHRNQQGYSFAIASSKTDVSVGSIFVGLHSGDNGRATLGYWIIEEFRGRKILSNVLPELVKWIWNDLKIIRLELYVEPWNAASIKVAQSLGFENEGLMRSWQQVGKDRKDMYMFSMIRPDGAKQQPSAT